MIAVRHDYLRIIPVDRNDQLLILFYRVNFLLVYNYPYIQKTKKNLFFSCDDDMVRIGNKIKILSDPSILQPILQDENYFKALMI